MSTSTQSRKDVAPIVASTNEWREKMAEMAQRTTPSFFPIVAQLPKEGRTNQVLGASRYLNVVLKTYASGGENELHAHTNEDHLFVVLQGAATFYGPNGETREVTRHDCVLLPAGSLYRFTAHEEEPLVLLRVGAAIDPDTDLLARVDAQGKAMDGYSKENFETGYVLHEDRWFE